MALNFSFTVGGICHLEIYSDALQNGHGGGAVLVALVSVDRVVGTDTEVTQLHDARLFV